MADNHYFEDPHPEADSRDVDEGYPIRSPAYEPPQTLAVMKNSSYIFMKIVFTVSSIVAGIMSILSGLILISRLRLYYNEQGNYFNESSAVVYHQQAIIGYGILTFIFLVMALLLGKLNVKGK